MKILILLLFIPLIDFAQSPDFEEGLIIKNNNDSIYGLIKKRNQNPYYAYTEIKFKSSDGGKIEIFTPDSVKEYILDGTRYISKYLKQKKRNFFYKVIVDGYVSFYELELQRLDFQNPNSHTYYAILQKRDETTELSFAEIDMMYPFKKRMMEFLKDAPDLCNKIRNGIYDQTTIEKIVKEYNKLHKE
ncbi:MAG: hypothetical protein ABI685_05110 [Ferruginibacter sp.]